MQGVDLRAGLALDRRVRSLDSTRPDLSPSLRGALDNDWLSMQSDLAALSSESVHIVALRSDHFVQQRLTGQPDVVIRAVREVVRAHHSETGLAPCASIFRGLAVRCRS